MKSDFEREIQGHEKLLTFLKNLAELIESKANASLRDIKKEVNEYMIKTYLAEAQELCRGLQLNIERSHPYLNSRFKIKTIQLMKIDDQSMSPTIELQTTSNDSLTFRSWITLEEYLVGVLLLN